MHSPLYTFLLKLVLFVFICVMGVCTRAQDTTIVISPVSITTTHSADLIPPMRMDSAALQRISGQNLADALRFFAGTQIKDYGGIGGLKTINIRSMGSQHVAVSYDGVLVGNAQNGIVDLGRFSLANLEAVALYASNQSSLTQSARAQSIGALLELSSRTPSFREGEKFRLQATYQGGSFGLIAPSFRYAQKLTSRLSLSASVELVEAHGRYPFHYSRYNLRGQKVFDTTAVRKNGDVHLHRIELSLHQKLLGGLGRIRAYYYNSERGLPGAIVTNVWRRGERQADRNYFVQGLFKKNITAFYTPTIALKLASDYQQYKQLDPRFFLAHLTFHQLEASFSTTQIFCFSKYFASSLAYDMHWNRLAGYNHTQARSLFEQQHPERLSHYIAASAQYTLEGLQVLASLLSIGNTVLHSPSEKPMPWTLLPNITLAYKHRSLGISCFLQYRHALRLPTFNELYYTDFGNANLLPERSTLRNAGVRWSIRAPERVINDILLLFEGYYSHITNKIVAFPTRGQFRWSTLNLGKVRTTGVDCTVRLGVQAWNVHQFSVLLQYSYTHAIDISDPKSTYFRHQIQNIPRHSGSLVASYQYNHFLLIYNFFYAGSRYHLPENIRSNYEPALYISDLAFDYEFNIFALGVRTRLSINNLWGRPYSVVLNYPMPEQNFNVMLQITW